MKRLFAWGTALCLVGMAGSAMAQNPKMLISDSNDNLYDFDPDTGTATLRVGMTGDFGIIGSLAWDPFTSTLYGTDTSQDELVKIDMNTGAITDIGSIVRTGIDPVMHGLEFNTDDGLLYGLDFRDKALVKIDPLTGTTTTIGITSAGSFASLAWDAQNKIMYMGDAGTDSLYKVSLVDGSSTLIGNTGITGSLGTGMAWSANYGLLGVDNSTDTVYKFDVTTGLATAIGPTSPSTNPLGLTFLDPVPEPATMAVLGLGALALLRKKRKKA